MEFNKTYPDELENKFRMKIFSEYVQNIVKHNDKFRQGLVSYSLKTNEFSDMPHQDFVTTMNGYNQTTALVIL